MVDFYQSPTTASQSTRLRRDGLAAAVIAVVIVQPGLAQSLPLPAAAHLAAERAPMVNTGTLLAFAWHESRLHPFAVHDNTTGQTAFPTSAGEAASLAHMRLTQGHSLDLGIMQVNSANLARTGLTLTTAFDAGESLRAGAMILTAAYRQCLHDRDNPNNAEAQAALRCTASVYNTGREQAGILNGYQGEVWRAAALVVPAIQFSTAGTLPSPPGPRVPPEEVVAPEPRGRPATALEDAIHATPPVQDPGDGLSDALHLTEGNPAP